MSDINKAELFDVEWLFFKMTIYYAYYFASHQANSRSQIKHSSVPHLDPKAESDHRGLVLRKEHSTS